MSFRVPDGTRHSDVDIYYWAPEGRRQHVLGAGCWCVPEVFEVRQGPVFWHSGLPRSASGESRASNTCSDRMVESKTAPAAAINSDQGLAPIRVSEQRLVP